MRRRRKFKVQLAFAGAAAFLFVFYAWNYHDLIQDVTGEETPLIRQVSGIILLLKVTVTKQKLNKIPFVLPKQNKLFSFVI